MTHIYGKLIKAVLYIERSKWRHRPLVHYEILLDVNLNSHQSSYLRWKWGVTSGRYSLWMYVCICVYACVGAAGVGGAQTKCFNSCFSPPPCLIQQPLYPEVRGLDPLMWALWRGVNHQQLNSTQEDFRVVGLWSRREGLHFGEGVADSLVWENA